MAAAVLSVPRESPHDTKSPKKRLEEATEDDEEASVVRKKLSPFKLSRRVEKFQLPEESSSDIVEVVEISRNLKPKNEKKSTTRRIQTRLDAAFSTPKRTTRGKPDDATRKSSTVIILEESVTVTPTTPVIRLPNEDVSSKSPGLNASHHHMTTPDVGERKGKKPSGLDAFVQVRARSQRQATKLHKEQEEAELHKRILEGKEDPRIEVQVFEMKGRGLVAKAEFQADEFVVEYSGELITKLADAKKKEAFYEKHPDKYGSYMYFFKHRNATLCVDATAETGRFGRLLNHSRTAPNLRTEVVEIKKKPFLILRASRHIKAGEELVYDYGDRTPASLASFPWLKK